MIPRTNYAFEKIRPLNEIHEVNEQLEALINLTELAFVSKILLAAQYRAKGKDSKPLEKIPYH